MRKLIGCICVFFATGRVWYLRRQERRRKRLLLGALVESLDRMETEIRLQQTPLPLLFQKLAQTEKLETAAFFQRVEAAGEHLPDVWRQAVVMLPLSEGDKLVLSNLAETLQGDEESSCKGISLVRKILSDSLSQLEKQRPEDEKRAVALSFSAAAMMVILLI